MPKKVNLTEEQISKIKDVASKYISEYTELFKNTEKYSEQLKEISEKLNDTVAETQRLREEENAMYESISKEYSIEMNALKDLIIDLFTNKPEK